MTWYIKYSYCIRRDTRKLWKGKKRKIFKIYWNKCCIMKNMQFFSWELITGTEACSLCPECSNANGQVVGRDDTCMNGQSVSEIWPRMISYMNLPFSKENHVRLTDDILLNSCLYTYWSLIAYDLFCEITKMEELSN